MLDTSNHNPRVPPYILAADFLTGLVAVLGVFALACVVDMIRG